jgi:hypothetical protein
MIATDDFNRNEVEIKNHSWRKYDRRKGKSMCSLTRLSLLVFDLSSFFDSVSSPSMLSTRRLLRKNSMNIRRIFDNVAFKALRCEVARLDLLDDEALYCH